MTICCRPYQTEEDYWRMRAFLRAVYVENGHQNHSWHVARLEYARWHTCLNCAGVRLEDVTTLWEQDGELIGFVLPDGGRGEAHLNIAPRWRSSALEEEMIATAEERLWRQEADGTRSLTVWARAGDGLRQDILARRGYARGDEPEHNWQRDLRRPVEMAQAPAGTTVRSLGDGLELLERCYASGLGFHNGDIRVAVENREDVSWYRNIQTAALYRRDLDIVAVAPDGSVAAFCTAWLDDVTRSAIFEPVATVPAHQRRGLGKAMMTEAMRRLQRMGALHVSVAGFSTRAIALYTSVMGPERELYEPWEKRWGAGG